MGGRGVTCADTTRVRTRGSRCDDVMGILLLLSIVSIGNEVLREVRSPRQSERCLDSGLGAHQGQLAAEGGALRELTSSTLPPSSGPGCREPGPVRGDD